MEFEQILLQINEIFHKSITQYKQEVIGKSEFSDVTVSQLFYLEAIYQLDSPTLSELADHLKVSKASATSAVQKLVKKGLAEKVQSSADQRVHYVHLSNDGLRLIEAEMHAMTGFADNITESLSDSETRQLMEIFQKIIAGYRG
jgi:DNA-binding MarR family transcriptional regulator